MSEAQTPYFLVALPQMNDPVFTRAVILIVQHDDQGAFGLLLNRPMKNEENEQTQMTAEVKDLAGNTLSIFSENLFGGGPVGTESIFALHEEDSLGSEESAVGEHLYLVTDPELFQKLLENDAFAAHRRFFMGFSSWESGQLESEIRGGAWMMVPYDRRYVFESYKKGEDQWSEHYWRRILLQSGVDPLTLIGQGSSDSGPN